MTIQYISSFEDKVWGKTRCDCFCEYYSHHTLRLEAGGVCSVHYHQHRMNKFKVQSGRVAIVELFGWMPRRTLLGPGEEYSVPSLVPHQFQALSNGQMIEEYYPDRGGKIALDDIVRLTEGFKTNLQDLLHLKGVAKKEDFE